MDHPTAAHEAHTNRVARLAPPVFMFGLAVVIAAAIAVYQITVAYGAVSPENGTITRVPLSFGQTAFALSFIAWPALGLWSAWQRLTGVAWTATGIYTGLSFLLGFSFGGAHLVFAAPLMLIGSLWLTLRADKQNRQGAN